MTRFDTLTNGTDFHIGEYIDTANRAWWEYRCAYSPCVFLVQSASAVDADLGIKEHILTAHPERGYS